MESIWRGESNTRQGVRMMPQPSRTEYRQPTVRDLLQKIAEEKEMGEQRKETKQNKKPWSIPWKWKSKGKEAEKKRDTILVFYLNIKGEIEQPMVVPIYGGNMIIIRNKIYEVDPRAVWSLKTGGWGSKTYKCLVIKEIDRRPVSNLDLDEIKRRGDSTDSDEFLIKAALKAQTTQTIKPMSKGILIIAGIAILALVVFFLWK